MSRSTRRRYTCMRISHAKRQPSLCSSRTNAASEFVSSRATVCSRSLRRCNMSDCAGWKKDDVRPAANPREEIVFPKPFGIISQSACAAKRANKAERSGGAGGAKSWDQGECESAAHGPDAEPGNRATGAGAHTSNRKGTEERNGSLRFSTISTCSGMRSSPPGGRQPPSILGAEESKSSIPGRHLLRANEATFVWQARAIFLYD